MPGLAELNQQKAGQPAPPTEANPQGGAAAPAGADLGWLGSLLLNATDRGLGHSFGSSGGLGADKPMLMDPEISGLLPFTQQARDFNKSLPTQNQVQDEITKSKQEHPTASAVGRGIGQLPWDIMAMAAGGPVLGGGGVELGLDTLEGMAGRRPMDSSILTDTAKAAAFAKAGQVVGNVAGNVLEPVKSFAGRAFDKTVTQPVKEFFGRGKGVGASAGVPPAAITPSRGAAIGVGEAEEKGLLQTRPDASYVRDAPRQMEQTVADLAAQRGRPTLLKSSTEAGVPLAAREGELAGQKALTDVAAQVPAGQSTTKVFPISGIGQLANRELEALKPLFPKGAADSPEMLLAVRDAMVKRMQSPGSAAARADFEKEIGQLDTIIGKSRANVAGAELTDRQIAQQGRVKDVMEQPAPTAMAPGESKNPLAMLAKNPLTTLGFAGSGSGLLGSLAGSGGQISPAAILSALAGVGTFVGHQGYKAAENFSTRKGLETYFKDPQKFINAIGSPIWSHILGTPLATEALKPAGDLGQSAFQRALGIGP